MSHVAAPTTPAERTRAFHREVALAGGCLVGLLAGQAVGWLGGPPAVVAGLLWVALILGSLAPLAATRESLASGQIDIDLLMLLAGYGAAAMGYPAEGALLMFLFSASGALETYAERRTAAGIEALKEQLSTVARRLEPDGSVREVAVEELVVGDRLLVRPGDRVPADGTVLAGESSLNQAALTGESAPVYAGPGARVLAGSINLPEGALTIVVDRAATDSTLARMIELVRAAQQNRAATQRFTDWFAQRYTRVVILGTALALLAFHYAGGLPWPRAVYRAMALLVVASPCAIVLATPAAMLSAIAGAARRGLLVKGGGCFEDLAAARVIVFDKTGTLTCGRPRLERVVTLNGADETTVLRLAASAEARSEHPLAAALLTAATERGLTLTEPDSFEIHPGRGLSASIEGRRVLVGSRRLFADEGLPVPECPEASCPHQQACTRALIVGTPEPIGLLDVTDQLRPAAAATVDRLRALGLRTVMLTGDAAGPAGEIARQVHLDEVRHSLLPAGKLTEIERLKRERGPVVMVGDGVNDAPALAAASTGVAMGGIGSDSALETADVVLTSDDLARLPELFALARRTVRVVRQNLTVAVGIIALMATTVLLTDAVRLPLAVVAHEGGTVLVLLNGLRLLRG